MCGNDISTVIEPEGGWRNNIMQQLANNKLKISTTFGI